jgi:hypothetical protein
VDSDLLSGTEPQIWYSSSQCRMALARAYAVGLYTEDGQHEVDEVAVLAGSMHRSLVLVMDRDVAGHHIAKGQAGI